MIKLIGIGNKARNGKDSLANYLSEKLPNTVIIHWADSLYEEVTNADRAIPLITRKAIEVFNINGDTTKTIYRYCLYTKGAGVEIVTDRDAPELHKIFEDRKINQYDGMDEKDPEMLQWWGTGYKRRYNKNYWTDRVADKIAKLEATNKDAIVLIPDTRFKNEYDYLVQNNHTYIRVIRNNEDGTRYIAKDRDPNHPSEIDIDDVDAHYELIAKSGEMDKIEEFADFIIQQIKDNKI